MRRLLVLYFFIFLIALFLPGLLAFRLGIILGGAAALPGLFGLSFFLYFWGRRFPGIYIPGTRLIALVSFLTILFFGAVGNETARQFFGGLRNSLQTATTEVAEGVNSLANQVREANRIWLAKKGTAYYREDGRPEVLEKDTKVFLLQEENGGTQRFGWFLLPNKFGHFDPKAGSEKVKFAFSDLAKKEEKPPTQAYPPGTTGSGAQKGSAARIDLGPARSSILLPVEIAPNTKVLEGHGSLAISWEGGTGFIISCPDSQIKIQRFSDAGWIRRGTALGAFPWNIMGSNRGRLEIKALRVEFLGPAQRGFARRLFIEPLGGNIKIEGELEFRQIPF